MNEPRTTKAGDWFASRQQGQHLPEHQLCPSCSQPSQGICEECVEATLEAEVHQ